MNNPILPSTLVRVDDNEPCTWADFLAANVDGLCEADIATIHAELERDGFSRFDFAVVAVA